MVSPRTGATTLRLTAGEVAAVERLKRATGERTASHTLLTAAKMHPSLLRERRECAELRR